MWWAWGGCGVWDVGCGDFGCETGRVEGGEDGGDVGTYGGKE